MENTLINRVKYACDNCDMEIDSADKLIAFAYYMGRESATRYVSDKYVEHIAHQRERARACRYWRMAEDVIGPERYLYMPDYGQEITALFGSDITQI